MGSTSRYVEFSVKQVFLCFSQMQTTASSIVDLPEIIRVPEHETVSQLKD